jgi:hypothetical protein
MTAEAASSVTAARSRAADKLLEAAEAEASLAGLTAAALAGEQPAANSTAGGAETGAADGDEVVIENIVTAAPDFIVFTAEQLQAAPSTQPCDDTTTSSSSSSSSSSKAAEDEANLQERAISRPSPLAEAAAEGAAPLEPTAAAAGAAAQQQAAASPASSSAAVEPASETAEDAAEPAAAEAAIEPEAAAVQQAKELLSAPASSSSSSSRAKQGSAAAPPPLIDPNVDIANDPQYAMRLLDILDQIPASSAGNSSSAQQPEVSNEYALKQPATAEFDVLCD